MNPEPVPQALCRASEVVLDPEQFGTLIYTLQGFTLAGVALACSMLVLGLVIYTVHR